MIEAEKSVVNGSVPRRRWQSLLATEKLDSELLMRARTHRSAGDSHYERLEFVGDAVLGLLVAEALYLRRPDAPEGTLTRLRAHLVNRHSLADIGREWSFGEGLTLGEGERKSGGSRRSSILADVVEATIGAVYLSSGLDATRAFVTALYTDRLERLPDDQDLKDPKTRLQEVLQRLGRPLPSYRMVARTGPDHDASFEVEAEILEPRATARAVGRSRRAAEQAAAETLLEQLSKSRR
ncbi:MAG: ribonuclease III [Thioalkalivibrionaceae bacterium]